MKNHRIEHMRKQFAAKGTVLSRHIFEMIGELEEANRRIQFLGDLANVCTHMDTGVVCPYCKCERRGVGNAY